MMIPRHIRHRLGQAGVLLVLVVGWTLMEGTQWTARAQTGPSLRSVERPIQVVLSPAYQWYKRPDGRTLEEASSGFRAVVPLGTRWTIAVGGAVAQMDGDDLSRVRGLTDWNGRVTYAQPVGEGSVVFSARVNVPVGKQRLDSAAVQTTRQISKNFYDFHVSSFSRGLSVSPQVTWAFPLSDRFAVGIGAGYKHQRGFEPEAGMDSPYVPGDGVGVNGGFDYKITDQSAIGLDFAFRRYGTDQVGSAPRFDAGNRATGTIRYLWRQDFTTVRTVVQYANWEDSQYGYRLRDGPRREQVIPSHGLALVSSKMRIGAAIDLQLRASVHRYSATVGNDAQMVGRFYASPAFEVGENLTLAPHGTLSYGSYTAVGGGLRIRGAF